MAPGTNEEKLVYKKKLKELCISHLSERIESDRAAMMQAQEAAVNEERSTAGDKYEVGRAMSQIDRDNFAAQLEEAQTELGLLNAIDTDRLYQQVSNGAVIMSGGAVFFIATGLGIIQAMDQKVAVLSPSSPFAAAMRGKKKGDKVEFNGNVFPVTDVF